MSEETYDKDEQHEAVEPLGAPSPVEDDAVVDAPEFVSAAEGDTDADSVLPSQPAEEVSTVPSGETEEVEES